MFYCSAGNPFPRTPFPMWFRSELSQRGTRAKREGRSGQWLPLSEGLLWPCVVSNRAAMSGRHQLLLADLCPLPFTYLLPSRPNWEPSWAFPGSSTPNSSLLASTFWCVVFKDCIYASDPTSLPE